MVNIELFSELLRDAPFQPATNLWRAVEIDAVIRRSLPAGRGLDLGCGDGRLTRLILSHSGPRYLVGVDLDEAETALARVEEIYSAVHTASATAIPEENEAFDFVFSNSVLEHIPELDDVLGEVSRVLRNGGKFLITVPSPGFHECLRVPTDGGKRKQFLDDMDRRCAHLHYWNLETWATRLASHGMRIVYSEEYLSKREVRRWQMISAMTGGLLYRMTGRKRRPIEIQRSLGMRSRYARLPLWVARLMARLLASGMEKPNKIFDERYGCLLIESERSLDA